MSIGSIGQDDFDEIQVETGDAGNRNGDISYLDVRQVAVQDEPDDTCIEDDRPRNNEARICLGQVIPVDNGAPVSAERFQAHDDHWRSVVAGAVVSVESGVDQLEGMIDPYANSSHVDGIRAEASIQSIASSRSRDKVRGRN